MFGPLATFLVVVAAATAGVGLARQFDAALGRLTASALCVVVAAVLAFGLSQPFDLALMFWLAIMVCGWTALAVTDALRHEIPDLISIPFLLLGLLQQWMNSEPLTPTVLAIAILFGLALIASVTAAAWRRGVGGGDVVLLGIALAWLGPFAMVDVLVLAAFLLIPQIAHVVVTGSEDRLPFAPAFGIATLVAWVSGPFF